MWTAARTQAPNNTRLVRLPRLHALQSQIVASARRFNLLCLGRRWGKNVLLRDRAADGLLRGQPVAWVAPSYRMLLDDWDTLAELLRPIITKLNTQERVIKVLTGGSIDFWSAENENAARGRKYARVIINEAAFIPRLAATWAQVIRPTLADLKGDAWLAGTPKGMNDYYTLFQAAADNPEWARWQASTRQNPHIDPAEIEAMRASLPERAYLQEIEAQFLEDGAGVFRHVAQAATAEPLDHGEQGGEYVIGVDWARTDDSTVFVVLDTHARRMVYIDRMNNTDYATQRARLIALYERFTPRVVLAEYNSMGGPQVEALQAAGLPVTGFTTTNATKAQIIDALAMAFERGELAIINDPVLLAELQAYSSERLPSGLVRYSAPEGMHDDTVIALALAWHSASGSNWIMS